MSQPLDQLIAIRKEKLAKIKNLGVNPYPSRVNRKQSIVQARKMTEEVAIAGRLMAWRGHGKLQFADLLDDSGKIQLVFKADRLSVKAFDFIKLLDIGDFLAVQGKIFKTEAGEISVLVKDFQLLVKTLRPLPDKWHGMADVEERYRKRYLDLLVNSEVKKKIILRTQVVKALRDYMDRSGFLEVETPILETIPTGALAKPFATHINAYDLPVFLRICMGELWQKRLMVAGLEKTYELGRAFRNEGVSKEHNPEFTMMEYYWAYADFEKNMDFQEKLIAAVVEKVTGQKTITYQGQKVDFVLPFKQKKYFDLIREETGVDVQHLGLKEIAREAGKKGLKVDKSWSYGKLIDEFYKEFVRPKIIGPLFLTHHPVELKPLAKTSLDDERLAESFQLLVCGFEVSNNYTELNDPQEQAAHFDQQVLEKQSGDEEAMAKDRDFIEALEYGMPPTTGAGIGVDRLVALLSDSHSLREVIAFPLMRPLSADLPSVKKS
jgi:lysyl-tRNA synthetase class 2